MISAMGKTFPVRSAPRDLFLFPSVNSNVSVQESLEYKKIVRRHRFERSIASS